MKLESNINISMIYDECFLSRLSLVLSCSQGFCVSYSRGGLPGIRRATFVPLCVEPQPGAQPLSRLQVSTLVRRESVSGKRTSGKAARRCTSFHLTVAMSEPCRQYCRCGEVVLEWGDCRVRSNHKYQIRYQYMLKCEVYYTADLGAIAARVWRGWPLRPWTTRPSPACAALTWHQGPGPHCALWAVARHATPSRS